MNRAAAVAGAFYPASPGELNQMVQALLRPVKTGVPAPKAIIVPHAGYIYSGSVAATAYARLEPVRDVIRRVVLLGPAHRVAVNGLATVSSEAFDTPLGSVPIDQQAISQSLALPQVTVSDIAHRQEHSLEVHLPFLQTCLDEFKLVPFVVGEASQHEVAEVLELLWGGDETLIVISSDLSHFHDYDTASRMDRKTSNAIVSLQPENISYEDACGRNPVKGLLQVARDHHFQVQMIDLKNSGDTAGSRDSVVGYGAYVLSTQPVNNTRSGNGRYTWQEGQTLLDVAKQSIQYGLTHAKSLPVNLEDYDGPLRQPRASFVTLKIADQLRGCIGSLQASRPLVEDISENAFAAAFRDPRFAPLRQDELDQLDFHISILSLPQPMDFSDESDLISQIRPGIDGLILEDKGRKGTFLPSVWESLPEREQFWQQLKLKAGLPTDHWSDTLKLSRYTTQAFS
jgi:AmmeMemoRadiSam system protein B/AmmeMemoRadiSam system protein A